MTATEKATEQQYNISLGDFAFQFSKQGDKDLLLRSGVSANMICFPDYYPGYDHDSWTEYCSTPTGEASALIHVVKRQSESELTGVKLFNAVLAEMNESDQYMGRTSHVLFSMFNNAWIEEDSLEELVRDPNNGQRINPAFNSDAESLPPNLMVRKAILNALERDRKYHEEIGKHNDNELAKLRVDWYQKVIDKMTQYTEIKPAEQKLM